MRIMLKLCDNFANDLSNIFNAKKSKCLIIASQRIRSRQCGLCDNSSLEVMYIQFVDEWSHLDLVISVTNR